MDLLESKTPHPGSHASIVFRAWNDVKTLSGRDLVLDGSSLDLAGIVSSAVSRSVILHKECTEPINASVRTLQEHLSEGEEIYGVNTGFGGSANTRTGNVQELQQALAQLLHVGILSSSDTNKHRDGSQSHSMPSTWVKAMIVVRINSLVRGHSGVRLAVIEGLAAFLKHDLLPVVPLRGSISASGDLIPLSYVVGVLTGNPDVYVRKGGHRDAPILTAANALHEANLTPMVLHAKEALGLLNGTAASCAIASLALYQTHHLAALSQVLTAMACEALGGSAESFHPFIAHVRPHRGQVEAAANILSHLSKSKLAQGLSGSLAPDGPLLQDRYALRTSSQWIGPQLEDLILAQEQLTVEMNSTTDNPLINVKDDFVHHVGNFQAVAVTSAMEKTRLAIQMIGKLLFAQATELINPMFNSGLPPNLAADDPSLSFTCKGVDIMLAACTSELGFLANPVGTHVQSAEMHNQSVNSLALLSARYTCEAVEVATQLAAGYLFVVCQALDLRVREIRFFEKLKPRFHHFATRNFGDVIPKLNPDGSLPESLLEQVGSLWAESASLDLVDRCEKIAGKVLTLLLSSFLEYSLSDSEDLVLGISVPTMQAQRVSLTNILFSTYNSTRQEMFRYHNNVTPMYLGQGSRKMYTFIRKDLGIPFHRGLVEHPTYALKKDEQASVPAQERRNIGSWISVIHEAIKDGRAHEPVMRGLSE